MRDWAVGQAGGRCYSWAALSSNDSKTRYTMRQNELFSEVWKLFSQSCTDVPAQLPSAMLPRQARGTCKKTVIQTSETVHFVSWYVLTPFIVDVVLEGPLLKCEAPLFRRESGKVSPVILLEDLKGMQGSPSTPKRLSFGRISCLRDVQLWLPYAICEI